MELVSLTYETISSNTQHAVALHSTRPTRMETGGEKEGDGRDETAWAGIRCCHDIQKAENGPEVP